MIYPVNERFATFQGEGVHMGRAAFFIRLHGCPVRCPWCDSAGTWHPTYVPKDVIKMSAMELCSEVQDAIIDTVVVTGGEPTVYDLEPLAESLHKVGVVVHLETSGTFPFTRAIDWVTLSPKKWRYPLRQCVEHADEFKIIVEQPEDIDFYVNMLLNIGSTLPPEIPIWLHPEWSHREDPIVLEAIVNAVKTGSPGFRAGWQLHKCYQVDRMDVRSRAPVPLGGNPMKGL